MRDQSVVSPLPILKKQPAGSHHTVNRAPTYLPTHHLGCPSVSGASPTSHSVTSGRLC